MDQIIIYSALVLFGLALGSFAGAQVWRLRAKQLKEDKEHGEKIDKNEFSLLKPLLSSGVRDDRSRCLNCQHPLAWYDLLPLVSWVFLRGKCRYCHRKIGWFEPLMEVGVALFFVASYIWWPYELSSGVATAQFILWLICGLGLAILLAYDAKWFLLPDTVTFPLMAIAGVSAAIAIISAENPWLMAVNVLSSLGILSGLYFILYVISKGAWVGFGDIKLGVVLALLLADWKLALLALFLANVIGMLIVLPGMLSKKLTRSSHVPFGPMLIGGWLLAGLVGNRIIDWYLNIIIF